MRRVVQGALVVGMGMFLTTGVMAYTGSYIPGSGIIGTVHDLGTMHDGMDYRANPLDAQQRTCVFCHAPHNTYKLSPFNGGPGSGVGGGVQAADAFDYLPLWNHEQTGNFASYTMYQNGPGAPQAGAKASQAILNGMTAPGGVSLLCLSCHDGSVAVNSYGNATQRAASFSNGGGPTIDVRYQIGKDNYLGNHHPIGFNYDQAQTGDVEIVSADTASFGAAGLVRTHLYGTGSNMMECATCHSVHNKGNTGETLLWTTDQASGLCLTCHDK